MCVCVVGACVCVCMFIAIYSHNADGLCKVLPLKVQMCHQCCTIPIF